MSSEVVICPARGLEEGRGRGLRSLLLRLLLGSGGDEVPAVVVDAAAAAVVAPGAAMRGGVSDAHDAPQGARAEPAFLVVERAVQLPALVLQEKGVCQKMSPSELE